MHDPPCPAGCSAQGQTRDILARSKDGGTGTHYFESLVHREDTIRYVVSGILPLKFAYAGSAAHTHDRLARTHGYQSVVGSVDMEVRTLLKVDFPMAGLSSIAEVGPGNGTRTTDLLAALRSRGLGSRRYLGLDFSQTLLDIACAQITWTFGDTIEVTRGVWDIEAGPSCLIDAWRAEQGKADPVLVCVLGHTLGNVEASDRTLSHLHASLRHGDLLLASVSLSPPGADEASTLSPYHTEVFRTAALEPLRCAGIDLTDIEFDVRYTGSTIIGEVTFIRTVQVGASTLPPGHKVRCFSSRRFTMNDMLSLFPDPDWTVVAHATDDSGEHACLAALRGGR
jgi:L-histidine N-alpha-methyltransferase